MQLLGNDPKVWAYLDAKVVVVSVTVEVDRAPNFESVQPVGRTAS
jgi:hypothetical protein